MSLKVLLILLSFATISQCSDVCLCCDEQVVRQNLTDCRSIGRPVTQEESNFLLDYCYKLEKHGIYYTPNRIATIQQFDSSSVNYVNFPVKICNEIFHSMDGLLYLLPESDSALFTKLFDNVGCYAAVQKYDGRYEETVPGVVCYSGYRDERTSTFQPLKQAQQVNLTNPTRYVYFLRRPVSYKITKVSHLGTAPFTGSGKQVDLGKFTACLKHNMDANSTISIKYKTETTLNFMPFSKLYDQMMSNGYSMNSYPITFELTDVQNQTRIIGYTMMDEDIHYQTDREYTIPLKKFIRPRECVSAIVWGSWVTTVNKAIITFEINLGNIGSFKDYVVVNKSITVRESGITNVGMGESQLFGYLDQYETYIIIPDTTAILVLGCVLGMVVFGLVLLIVIKCGNCCDKTDFKKDWERISESLNNSWVIISTVTQEKVGIIGHRLARLGAFICNVGTWIYEEIDTSLSSYQDIINRSQMEDEENNPRE